MTDIVTITINPAIDMFVNTSRVEAAQKMRCSAPKRDPGGGGINVARAAFRLGADVIAIYPTGGALGKLLHRLLEREGIVSLATPSHVETRENFTAYEEDTGVQFRFVLPGSRLHRAEWEAVLDKLATFAPQPAFVVASGSLPPGVPDDFFAQVARLAKTLGARPVIDTSRVALKQALVEGVYLVKPNLNELSDFIGAPLEDDGARIAACRALIHKRQAEIVALTLGAEGALLVTKDRALKAEAVAIEVASTVGAGDSFLGGLVATLAAGQSLEDAFRVGIAAASAAVMSPGTELCRRIDVERLLPQVVVRELAAAM